jgi:8-oxo-dGTP pyrophosphatase MutT (NUDIX family)
MQQLSSDDMLTRLRALSKRTRFEFPAASIPDDFRRSAVLILFWHEDGEVRVVLTRRNARMRSHPGQVAFPGGKLEPGEDWRTAALREAEEEVGIAPDDVEVMGLLDDAWSGARHHLVPVVGWLHGPARFRANPDEVAEILIAPVSALLAPEAKSHEVVEHQGMQFVNAILQWPEGRIYGLSADLMLEALAWLGGEDPSRGPVRLGELIAIHGLDPEGSDAMKAIDD